jgi:hypothetical protein
MMAAMSLWLCTAVLCSLVIVGIAGRASQRAQAQTVADAVALAGAAGGSPAAEQIALANRAELVSLETLEATVTVRITVDGVDAVASAAQQIHPRSTG